MTTVEPIVLDEFTLQLVVQLIDTGDIVNTGRGVADITDFITQTALPVIRGPKGPQGDPGLGIKPLGTVTTASARPTGLGNNTTDVGKAYFTADDYKLNVWTGTAWITSGSLRGQTGPTAAIGSADDYDGSGGAAAAGAFLRYRSGKWAPEATHAQVLERTSAQTIPDSTFTAIGGWAAVAGAGYTVGGTGLTRIIPLRAGLHDWDCGVNVSTGGGNRRELQLRKNGTEFYTPYPVSSTAYTGVQARVPMVPMNGTTDYVEWMVAQNSGGDRTLVPDSHGIRCSHRYVMPL